MLVDPPSISVMTRSKALKLKFLSPSSMLVNFCALSISSTALRLDLLLTPLAALET